MEGRADVVRIRKVCSNVNVPAIFTWKGVADCEDLDVKVEKVQFELPLPALFTCWACNADYLLSSVHLYSYCAKVVLPTALRMRMFMKYPRCKCNGDDQNIVLQCVY